MTGAAVAPPLRRPRLWERHTAKLYGGRHGLPPPLVRRIQRDRLTDAMVAVVASVGYHDTSVEKVIGQAGVSRRTFYDLFDDREDCFLAAYQEVADWVLSLVEAAHARGSTPHERVQLALDAFLSFLAEEPDAARTCIVEVLAAGPKARAARARTMERLAAVLEPDMRRRRGDAERASFAARAFVGGLHELAHARIERGDIAQLPTLGRELMAYGVAPLMR